MGRALQADTTGQATAQRGEKTQQGAGSSASTTVPWLSCLGESSEVRDLYPYLNKVKQKRLDC